MELKESKRVLRIPQSICDEFEERAVDMDVVLPDYCPDVAVILKCIMRPVITARFQSGDRYSVDGMTTLRILYLAEDRVNIHSYEVTQPFNAGFRVNGAVHHHVDVKSDYVNCRATGPRRVDIHGAFRVYLKAFGEGSVTVFADPSKRDICCRTRSVSGSVPMCEAEKSFTVSETVALGTKADKMIYTDAVVSSCEYKTLMNKLIVKGSLSVKTLYAADDTVADTVREIPFSQIIDVEGLRDDWQCKVRVDVGENESYLQQAENGGGVLLISCKLTACVHCSMTDSAEVVLDAYSVDRPLLCETTPIHLTVDVPAQTNKMSLHQTTQLPEGVSDVVDVWGEMKNCELKDTDGTRELVCCVMVSMIARDDTGHLGYYERTVDYHAACDPSVHDVCARLIAITGSVVGNQLRVQAEIEQSLKFDNRETLSVVCGVLEDEQQAFQKNGAAIRIVYANPGELLWDIAKQHHSSVQDILMENDLTSEEISAPMMLMIPMI